MGFCLVIGVIDVVGYFLEDYNVEVHYSQVSGHNY